MTHPADRLTPIDPGSPPVARGILGGTLMGLANLVPGISGGTMLLAAGIYPDFIGAVSDLTRLRFRPRPLIVLLLVGGSAAVAIALGAGLLKDLVVDHRWVMYSLFIGLTLGGLPLVWRLARPASSRVFWGAAVGLVGMAAIGIAQARPAEAAIGGSNWLVLLVAGLAGASAMILPGVSGGYLLLVLGQYVPILAAIDRAKDAVVAGDLRGAFDPSLHVLLPVGIGVLLGIGLVSNLLRFFLARFEKQTLGFLLGLLLGAVLGLWPFQRPVEPTLGTTIIKGQLVTAENRSTFDSEDFPTERFPPSAAQAAAAVALIAVGFAVTLVVARVGGGQESRDPGSAA